MIGEPARPTRDIRAWRATWHVCPVAGCGKKVRHDRLTCFAHWRLISPEAQRAVYEAWDCGRQQGSAAHLAACERAIAEAQRAAARELQSRRKRSDA